MYKMNRLFLIFLTGILLLGMYSCEEKIEWQTHESGLRYHFITRSELGSKVKPKDILVLKMKYSTQDDSLLFDTREIKGPYRMQFTEPSHKGGSVEDAFSLLHVGDSMHFKVNAKNFFEKTRHMGLPKGIHPDSDIVFEVRLQGVQSLDQIQEERRAFRTRNATEEEKVLARYLNNANITQEPTMSGLYIIPLEEGTGKKAVAGKEVSVHYTGKLIDGMVFDSSRRRNQPLSFVLGAKEVIQGWEEGVATMREGDKVRLIIPSILAYGDQSHPKIPPFSTLIFDIELLEVK